jgi:cyclase
LLRGVGLVKTLKFRHPKYVGDPINAVKLFNDLEVDELVVLDTVATKEERAPDYDRVREIAGECFMPVCYGGGIRSVEHARRLFQLGVEKIAITSATVTNPELVSSLAAEFGSQSVIVGIDVKLDWLRRRHIVTCCGTVKLAIDPIHHACEMERYGAGEIFLNSVDRDGTQQGYDLELIEKVSHAVNIPVIACGGAGSISDIVAATNVGASAAAAGSLFVFQGRHRAVMINYPSFEEIQSAYSGAVQKPLPKTIT